MHIIFSKYRYSVLALVLFVATPTHGQAVHRKHLLTTYGAGLGQLNVSSGKDTSGYAANNATCGVVRFAFAYALTDHWSLGFHYDRLGAEGLTIITNKVRFTTYQLEAIWRPWIGKYAALEAYAAIGPDIMALTPRRSDLPLRSRSGVITIGGRYLQMFGNVIGAYLAMDHSMSGEGTLTKDGAPVIGSNQKPIQISWTAQRVSAGMIVRF